MDLEHIEHAVPQTLVRIEDTPMGLVELVEGKETSEIFLVPLPSLQVAVFVDIEIQSVFQDLQLLARTIVGFEVCLGGLERDA